MAIGFNTFIVCISTSLLGVVAGAIGVFLSLRKRALLSDALAHGSLPGLCLAYLIGFYIFGSGRHFSLLLLGACVSAFLSTVLIQSIVSRTRIREDAALASVLSIFFGFGVLLLGIIQNVGSGEEGGLNHFIYGQTAAMGSVDALMISATTILILSIIFISLPELTIVCFSEEFAHSLGIPTSRIDICLMILSSIVIVIGLQAVGMLLIVALLVIPAAAAKYLSVSVTAMIRWSSLIGGASGLIGSLVSANYPHMPTGGVIVLISGVFFIFSILFGSQKGFFSCLYVKEDETNG